MNLMLRLLGIQERSAEPTEPSEVPQKQVWPPPSRRDETDSDPLSLIPIYRALQVLTTAAGQLPLTVERGGTIVDKNVPAHIRRPDPDMDRSDWIEQAVLSLALNGNLFIRKVTAPDGSLLAARVLPPAEVIVGRNAKNRRRAYFYRGDEIPASEINHQTFMRLPGRDRGMGPIQAARTEVHSAVDVREYAGNWFRGSGEPAGLLSSKAAKSADEAKAIRKTWNDAALDPENPTRVRVIGGDTTYTSLMLAPEDAQWLEVRQFNVTDFARLFGIPSSLMLAVVEGNSRAYANVEQEWLAFTRFTLMGYLRKIEEALTDLSPLGQTVRFNIEVLLRTDTKSRYDAHAVGLDKGFLTVDEVRKIEHLPPLTDAQRAQLATHQETTTP